MAKRLGDCVANAETIRYVDWEHWYRRLEMKKFAIALALVATTAGSAFAGGPAVIGGEPEVIVNPPATGSVGSAPIAAAVGGLVLLCLIACGGSDSATTTP
jgi:hypothetical protein